MKPVCLCRRFWLCPPKQLSSKLPNFDLDFERFTTRFQRCIQTILPAPLFIRHSAYTCHCLSHQASPSFSYCRQRYPGTGYDVRHPHDASLMTYRGHGVQYTLIRWGLGRFSGIVTDTKDWDHFLHSGAIRTIICRFQHYVETHFSACQCVVLQTLRCLKNPILQF